MIDEKEIERIMLDAYETWLSGRPPGRVPWSIDAAHAIAEAEAEKMREGVAWEGDAWAWVNGLVDFEPANNYLIPEELTEPIEDGEAVWMIIKKLPLKEE